MGVPAGCEDRRCMRDNAHNKIIMLINADGHRKHIIRRVNILYSVLCKGMQRNAVLGCLPPPSWSRKADDDCIIASYRKYDSWVSTERQGLVQVICSYPWSRLTLLMGLIVDLIIYYLIDNSLNTIKLQTNENY